MHPTASFEVAACRPLTRALSRSRRYLHVSIQAPTPVRATPRAPVHVAFVLDRSGSMHGDKLRLACKAVDHALGLLDPEDRFTLVTFDSEVEVNYTLTAATPDAIDRARSLLQALESGRTTNISGAWIAACEQLAPAAGTGPVLRVLLLSDGQANVGLTTASAFSPHVTALRERGVHTSVFGLGLDFDEEFLASVARAGGGNFYYVSQPNQIASFFAQELGESLDIVARNPRLELATPSHVVVRPLSDFPCDLKEEGAYTMPLPDLCSGQQIDVLLIVDIDGLPEGTDVDIVVTLHDDDGVFVDSAPGSVRFVSASHEANDAQSRNREVDRAVAGIYAAKAERKAIAYNRHHDFEKAEHLLTKTAHRIMLYAGKDPELKAIADKLREAVKRYAAPLDEGTRKSMHASTIYKTRSRDTGGASQRKTKTS